MSSEEENKPLCNLEVYEVMVYKQPLLEGFAC